MAPRKPVKIWRNWGLRGPLAFQVAVAKEAKRMGLTRRDGEAVRELATQMKGTFK